MNDENLIPFSERTESERRELARKAGKASGVSRSFKAAIKKKLYGKGGCIDDVVESAINEAMKGNVQALNFLRDTVGEKPKDEAEINTNVTFYFEGMDD